MEHHYETVSSNEVGAPRRPESPAMLSDDDDSISSPSSDIYSLDPEMSDGEVSTIHSVARSEEAMAPNDTRVYPESSGSVTPLPASNILKTPTESQLPIQIVPKQRTIIRNWILEIVALVLNIALITVLAIILALYNGRPITVWAKRSSTVSLNAVISVISTISKSLLVFALSASLSQGKWLWFKRTSKPINDFDTFDSASRDPLGSLKMLWKLKKLNLMSLACLTMILSVAFDPSIQLLVSYPGKLFPLTPSIADKDVSGQAIIPASLSYQAGTEVTTVIRQIREVDDTENSYGNSSASLDFSMIAAIYNGLDASGTMEQQLSYTCPTGNCSFPIFASLAVCSSCSDVSHMVKGAYIESESDAYNGPIGEQIGAASSYQVWQYKLLPHHLLYIDNEAGFANQSGTGVDDADSSSGFGFETMTSYSTSDPSLTIMNTKNQLLLQAITTMKPSEEYLNSSIPWNQSSIIATECALSLCVKTYNSTISSQVLHEPEMGSWSIPDLESYRPLPQSKQPLDVALFNMSDPRLGNSTWNPLYRNDWVRRTDISLKLPNDSSIHLPANKNPIASLRFNMSQKSVDALQRFFSTLNPVPSDDTGIDSLPQYCILYNNTYLTKSDLMRAICNTSNIEDDLRKLARSMTLTMRNYESANAASSGIGPYTNGTIFAYLNYISINWLYLILPCALSFFGIVVLLAAIVNSKSSATTVWKDSSLATLFHGLDEEALRAANDVMQMTVGRSESEVKEICGKTVLVRLLDGDDGVKLRVRD